jgi:hypothetical protein
MSRHHSNTPLPDVHRQAGTRLAGIAVPLKPGLDTPEPCGDRDVLLIPDFGEPLGRLLSELHRGPTAGRAELVERPLRQLQQRRRRNAGEPVKEQRPPGWQTDRSKERFPRRRFHPAASEAAVAALTPRRDGRWRHQPDIAAAVDPTPELIHRAPKAAAHHAIKWSHPAGLGRSASRERLARLPEPTGHSKHSRDRQRRAFPTAGSERFEQGIDARERLRERQPSVVHEPIEVSRPRRRGRLRDLPSVVLKAARDLSPQQRPKRPSTVIAGVIESTLSEAPSQLQRASPRSILSR